MITPEMYQNAKDIIERLTHELRQCKEIGNNLLVENAQLRSELEGWRAARTWADVPGKRKRIVAFRPKGSGYVPVIVDDDE